MLDFFAQAVITCTGCLSLYLIASQEPRTRAWAGIVGLAGEPFWMLTAYINGQWGIVALAVVYGVSWVRVVLKNWGSV